MNFKNLSCFRRTLWTKIFASYAFIFVITGCTTIYTEQQLAQSERKTNEPRKLFIFFDGTHNNVESNTNVKRLHALISLQNKPHFATLYVEGVGVNKDLFWGAGLGLGFEERVVLGYNFLRSNYHAGDKIYLFGFSRGSFEARALASMLYYIGLPDQPETIEELRLFDDQIKYVKTLYQEMKDGFEFRRYACKVAKVRTDSWYKSRPVDVMGLWDTVGALGGGVTGSADRILDNANIRAFPVDIDEPNVRYGDQLLNVKNVFHAVSLDDDREWIFTPLLMTRQHLFANKNLPSIAESAAKFQDDCSQYEPDYTQKKIEWKDVQNTQIHEVWFSGSHSDVGGGYAESNLSGVSLNWMISMLEATENLTQNNKENILPPGFKVREDVYGTSHDPDQIIYHEINRNLFAYSLGRNATCSLAGNAQECGLAGVRDPIDAAAGKLCIHSSVFKRRMLMPPKAHENHYLKLTAPAEICVRVNEQKLGNLPILEQSGFAVENSCPFNTRKISVNEWKKFGDCTYVYTLQDLQ